MRPGVTMRPLTSLTSAPLSCAPIPATRPFLKPTSITESTPCDGSITLPPRRTRSSCIKITFRAWNPLGCPLRNVENLFAECERRHTRAQGPLKTEGLRSQVATALKRPEGALPQKAKTIDLGHLLFQEYNDYCYNS